jgi:hypothetical protein
MKKITSLVFFHICIVDMNLLHAWQYEHSLLHNWCLEQQIMIASIEIVLPLMDWWLENSLGLVLANLFTHLHWNIVTVMVHWKHTICESNLHCSDTIRVGNFH